MNYNSMLNLLREIRNFDVELYLDRKIRLINNFFKENGLDSAVIGISGGIDSALVLYLLHKAALERNSPIKKIMPLTMPIHYEGISNQPESVRKAFMVMDNLGYEKYSVDLTSAYCAIIDSSKSNVHRSMREWAYGQMGSVLRTPVLYYHAVMLQTYGYRSIVVGTTNRDEGSYIGFFGKASDAMVDLQPIADIHKSEVIKVAYALDVPEEIIKAVPAGDVWDSSVDEEMIGAPYDVLEMYLLMKQYKMEYILSTFRENDRKEFDTYFANIEAIHDKNKHKYQVGSPAHFIDVMERKIPGGWQ